MGFTTPCFIRKNTPELRKKLEELGYSHGKPEYYIDDDDNKYDFIMCHNGRFFLLSQKNHVIRNGHPLKKHGSINCGTNESLFLAIAALRDDTDKNQWFVLDHDNIWEAVGCYQYKGDFILCNHDRWYCGTDVAQAHKATVKELKEFFSREIEIPTIRWNMGDVIYDASDYCHRIGVQKVIGKKVVYRNGEAVDASYCVHFYESGKRWVIMERLIGSLNAFIVAGERIIVTDNVIIPFCKFNPADINESIKYSLI